MRLPFRWRRRPLPSPSLAKDDAPGLWEEEPGEHGAPLPWGEARARLTLARHRALAAVLEEAHARLGDAARLEAFAEGGALTLRLAPARLDAAPVGLLAFTHDPTVHVEVAGGWMEWGFGSDAEEAARLRGVVDAAAEGRLALVRCRVGGRWREGFDLVERVGGRDVRAYRHRALWDPWWRGARVLRRHAPYA